jgi:hypothetical protein
MLLMSLGKPRRIRTELVRGKAPVKTGRNSKEKDR